MATKTASIADIPIEIDPEAQAHLKGTLKEDAEACIDAIKLAASDLGIKVKQIHVAYLDYMKHEEMAFIRIDAIVRPQVSATRYRRWREGTYASLSEWFRKRGLRREEEFEKTVYINLLA